MFRCKECGDELDHVEVDTHGWKTWTGTGYGNSSGLKEMGGEVSFDYVEVEEFEETDVIDSDEWEEIRTFRCPECCHEEELLDDLVEVAGAEAEEDEEVHGPYELVGAMSEQCYGFFDTLGEAIDHAEGELHSTWLFVRFEGKAVWVNKENNSQEGANFRAQPKGGELALDEDVFVDEDAVLPGEVKAARYQVRDGAVHLPEVIYGQGDTISKATHDANAKHASLAWSMCVVIDTATNVVAWIGSVAKPEVAAEYLVKDKVNRSEADDLDALVAGLE